VSETALDARIKIGAGLVQPAWMAIRHWLLGLVAIIAMAGCLLLLLGLGGHCFRAGYEACIEVKSLASMGSQGSALVGDVITIATLAAAFLVTVAISRLYFLGEPLVVGQGQRRKQELRLARYFGRTALVWAIGATPPLILETAYLHASWALYPDYAGPVELWISYIVIRGISITIGSYLNARLILFVPSVVYQVHPDGLRSGWLKTRPQRWRIFFVIWLVDLAIAIVQPLLESLLPIAIDLEALAQRLTEWSNMDASYVDNLVAPMLIYSILVPIGILWSTGFAVIVYRKLIVIDDLRATVFD
jgi:hypothetical protein